MAALTGTLLAAGLGAAGTIAASKSQSNAAKSAANASQQASDAAIAEQRRQYDLSRADQQPWVQTGSAALSQLGRLYGLNSPAPANAMSQPQPQAYQPGSYNYGGIMPGNGFPQQMQMGEADMALSPAMSGRAQAIGTGQYGAATQVPMTGAVTQQAPAQGGGQFDSFWQSPDYQYRMNEQMRALTARNSALGIQDSGAAQLAALRASGNLASGEFNNYANRLSALAGVGQTAANQNAQLGQNFAGSVGNILQNNAQNLSSSYAQQGQANAGLWGSLAGIGAGVVSNYPWGKK